MKNGAKFGLGLIIGAAIGATLAYLSDKEKRDDLLDNLSTATDKAKDGLITGYYEAKEKYLEYKDKICKETSKLEEATEILNDEIENI